MNLFYDENRFRMRVEARSETVDQEGLEDLAMSQEEVPTWREAVSLSSYPRDAELDDMFQ